MANISISAKSEKGRRKANEDAFLIVQAEDLGGEIESLMIIADGMGGRAGGALASDIAVKTVRDYFTENLQKDDISSTLAESLKAANQAVFNESQKSPELEGMGTTCVAAAFANDRLYFAHLGDSRAYLLRDGGIQALTEDHSFVAEKVRSREMTEDQARKSRFRNIITRAIGISSDAQPSLAGIDLDPGDVILLCTDGLSGAVSDDEIGHILCTSSDSQEACDRLVELALKNGSTDNITVAVGAYGAKTRTPERECVKPSEKRTLSFLMIFLLGALIGFGAGIYGGKLASIPWEQDAVEQAEIIRTVEIEYQQPISLSHRPFQGRYLTLDERGYLHVADTQGRIVRLDTFGQVIRAFPVAEILGDQEISESPMIASDKENNLYISDPEKGIISKYDSDGLFVQIIGDGELISPEALAVDENGAIFVIDAGRLKAIRPLALVQ